MSVRKFPRFHQYSDRPIFGDDRPFKFTQTVDDLIERLPGIHGANIDYNDIRDLRPSVDIALARRLSFQYADSTHFFDNNGVNLTWPLKPSASAHQQEDGSDAHRSRERAAPSNIQRQSTAACQADFAEPIDDISFYGHLPPAVLVLMHRSQFSNSQAASRASVTTMRGLHILCQGLRWSSRGGLRSPFSGVGPHGEEVRDPSSSSISRKSGRFSRHSGTSIELRTEISFFSS